MYITLYILNLEMILTELWRLACKGAEHGQAGGRGFEVGVVISPHLHHLAAIIETAEPHTETDRIKISTS